MEIREYSYKDSDGQVAQLLALYQSVGWANYTQNPAMLRAAYRHSLLTLAAFDEGQLAGVLRAVGDGASIVFVQDLLVFPRYQRRGVGSRLLRALMERYPQVYQLELATDDTEKTAAFYRSAGFVPLDELGCRGFIRLAGLQNGGGAL